MCEVVYLKVSYPAKTFLADFFEAETNLKIRENMFSQVTYLCATSCPPVRFFQRAGLFFNPIFS